MNEKQKNLAQACEENLASCVRVLFLIVYG